ncbi:MAG: alpha/beta hydrolase fold protein [Frankiales bacterium]|nr:alpha/beta hydrolase fold protein [Frankiales bacterium]
MTHESIWLSLTGTPYAVRQVQVGEWATRVLEAGAGSDVVVLLAGTGGHLEAYARNIGPLVQAGYRVVAYDYPGHGYTTLTATDLELPDYVAHLAGLLNALGIASAHLNGESLGGWIAVKFAAAYPDRVRKLVLNTPGGTMMRSDVMARIRALSQAAADDPSPEAVRARLEWLMADPASVTDELVAVRRAIYGRPGFSTSMRHLLCLQDPEIRQRNLITDEELAAVPNTALVVWTSDDPSGPAAAGMDMANKVRGGRFLLIDGAGHWPQWEQSDRFNAAVIGFLAE